MEFAVNVVADSVNAHTGARLTTVTACYPRFIHSEVMTHRDRERNAASSRAIPWSKMRAAIAATPVIPLVFGREQQGMQTGGEIDDRDAAVKVWLAARDSALRHADDLYALGVHKSIVNRLTEPFMWITIVMTATDWKNFFRLRCHTDAEVHFQKIAGMLRSAMEASQPIVRNAGSTADSWHLPFVTDDEREQYRDSPLVLAEWSTARTARVSYLLHDGTSPNPAKDKELFDRLCHGSGFGHWSPHGHPAGLFWCTQNALGKRVRIFQCERFAEL